MSIKGCVSADVFSRATSYACPVDGRPCVVLEPLLERMVEDLGPDGAATLIRDAAKHGLPCGSCRVGARDARNLAGLRLGKHERRILLFAPPGSKCGWRGGPGNPTFPGAGKVVYPEGPSRADEEANRRALRKLERVGLLELSCDWSGFDDEAPAWFEAKKARSRYWLMGRMYRTAKLTPLGELVVERCRQELEIGKPIRWQKLLPSLVEDVERPLTDLLREFTLWLGGAIFGAAFVMKNFARTEEARRQALQRGEAVERFKAFVFRAAGEGDA